MAVGFASEKSPARPEGGLRRRSCPIGVLLALGGLLWTPMTSAQTTVVWEPLATGLSVAVWEPGPTCDDEVSPLIAVRVDPERYRFATYHYIDEKLPAPLTIKEWQ